MTAAADAPKRYISAFAGVGGFDVALEALGWECVGQIEIADFPNKVLEKRFPNVKRWRDITAVDPDALPEFDVVCGGWPCFVAGTLILTRDGYRPIEDLRVGDEVLTHMGRWRPVTDTMRRRADATVKVRAHGVPEVRTTAEHPFLARARLPRRWDIGSDRWHPREFSGQEWRGAGQLAPGRDYVCQTLPDERPDEWPGADWWWLVGRYLADGWRVDRTDRASGGSVSIACREDEVAGLMERVVAAGYHATVVHGRTCERLKISSRQLYEALRPFGRYAHGKLLPGFALEIDAVRARALIDGWASGDGWKRPDGSVSVTTVSRALALSMALLCQRAYGVVASVNHVPMPDRCVIEGREVNQRDQYQVAFSVRNSSSFIADGRGWGLVRGVEEGEGAEVFNISVRDDESYVADGATVHNCQGNSVAGKRAGLADPRSGLFHDLLRLLDSRPAALFLGENVPGLLSVCSCGECRAALGDQGRLDDADDGDGGRFASAGHSGRDFALVLEGLTGFLPRVPDGGWRSMGVCAGPKRTAVWRVLDSRWFGVAQRRRRVFVVAGPGAERALSLLAESEGGEGDPAAGIAEGEGAAPTLAGGARTARGSGGWSEDDVPHVAEGPEAASYRMRGFGDYEGDGSASALKRRDHKDATDLIVDVVNGNSTPETAADIALPLRENDGSGNRQAILPPDEAIAYTDQRGRDGGERALEGETFTLHAAKGPSEQQIVVPADSPDVAHALRSQPQMAHREDQDTLIVTAPELAAPLTHGSHASHAPGRRKEDDVNLVVDAFALGSHAGTADGDATNRPHASGGPVGSNVREGESYSVVAGRGQAVAYSIRSDAVRDGEAKTPSADAEGRVRLRDPGMGVHEEVAPTVDAGAAHIVARVEAIPADGGDVASALRSSDGHDSEDGTGRQPALVVRTEPPMGVSENQRGEVRETPYVRQLTAGGGKPGQGYPAVVEDRPLSMYGHSGLQQSIHEDESPPITRGSGLPDHANPPIVLQDVRGLDKRQNGAGASEGGTAYTLDATGAQGVMADDPPTADPYNGMTEGGAAHTHGDGVAPEEPTFFQQVSSGSSGAGVWPHEGYVPPISTGPRPGGLMEPRSSSVRRLTPVECARLQAFPDWWCCLETGNDGLMADGGPFSTARCRCPDGPQYAAYGNGVTTSVVFWIGAQIDAAGRGRPAAADIGAYIRALGRRPSSGASIGASE